MHPRILERNDVKNLCKRPISPKLPQVNNNNLWKPKKISDIAKASIINGIDLYPKKIGPYKVIAIIGVKFGGWGTNLNTKTKQVTKKKVISLNLKLLLFKVINIRSPHQRK